MKKVKSLIVIALSLTLILANSGCGAEPSATGDSSSAAPSRAKSSTKLSIAYQYGLAYAPLIICKENNLIEKAYEKSTGKTVEVVWNQMSSGADINTGIASGDINVGFMGIAPAITGISKKVGYKIFTNLSGQEHGLMSNDSSIKSLGDFIGSDKQIALVNIGSIQHIILGLALDANGYGPHDLDSNLVAMKHPDGMNALVSRSISSHLTSNPYIYKERDNSELHELTEISDIWSAQKSFIVGVASESLKEKEPELYQALCDAISESIDTINSDFEATAKITCEYNGNTPEDELKYLKAGSYSIETSGIYELAQFMYKNEFIETGFESYEDLVFDNVKGD